MYRRTLLTSLIGLGTATRALAADDGVLIPRDPAPFGCDKADGMLPLQPSSPSGSDTEI